MRLSTATVRGISLGLLVLAAWVTKAGGSTDRRGEEEVAPESLTTLRMGGAGGVYLLAEPGELWVEVEKRDRNTREMHIDLRVLLVGPDRRVLQEEVIPEDGKPAGSGTGPVQQVRLRTTVERAGIYAVNITASQDRYGDHYLWGFRTNCPRYVIETSRGHRDARHLEPIVLGNADATADICFAPGPGPLRIEAEGLPAGSEDLVLTDGEGRERNRLAVDDEGRASAVLESGDPAGGEPAAGGPATRETAARDLSVSELGPWRLHLPAGQATVHIDGVTRWEGNDPLANLSLWTDRPAAWFDLAGHRWMLTPYSRTAYAAPGADVEVALQVHNNGDSEETFELGLEFDDEPWPAVLSKRSVGLGPGEATAVTVLGPSPEPGGGPRVCHVRATPRGAPHITTYSSVFLHGGPGPVDEPLSLPLQLQPYSHENEQFGYLPDYPVGQELYFDLQNRPAVWKGGGPAVLLDGQWQTAETELPDDLGTMRMACSKIAFDRAGDLYALGVTRDHAALLHSTDGGRTARTHLSKVKRGAWDLEQWSGHNPVDGPPALLHSIQVAADPDNIWRRINTLDLYLPRQANGGLVLGEPIRLSEMSLGVGSHSGIPSAVVSRGDMVHAIWAEPTDPDEDVPGVPTYVVSYDRSTRTLGEPALIGYGAPPNDVHNRPSITMDSQGYLHAMAGTHGQPFQYARSLVPNDAGQGWTEPESVGDRQTYIGLVCGPDDVLHLVYRYWRYNEEPYPHSHHATLAYQHKEPGQPWSAPRVLVAAPFSEYSIFYHKLTIDRRGRLFLNYDYWSTFWFYRTDRRARRRSTMMSPDGGTTWKLATGRDLE